MEKTEDIDKDLTGEIYTSNESWEVLTTLCMFGGRAGGTESERKAVNYLLEKLEEYGLDDPHLEEFEVLGWERGSSKLEVTAPVKKKIPCLGQVYSPSAAVEAPLINCEWGHPDVFKELGNRVKGKIVLLRTRASHKAIPGKALQETDTERYTRAVSAGAVGFINWNQVAGRSAMVRAMHYANIPGEIPATGISNAHGRILMDLLKKGSVTVKMRETHEMKKLQSWNVIGEIKGASEPEEIIFLGAHHDGRDINQGALNDASGAVVVMEAARALAKHKGYFNRTIKVAIFSCEVYGYHGSFAYVRTHKEEMEKIKLMMNLDAAGRPGGSGTGIGSIGRPELVPFFRSIADDLKLPYNMAIVDRFGIGSDHVPFMLQGIPTTNHQTSDPERTSGWPHEMGVHGDIISWRETEEDTIDKTRPEFVRRDAITVARVLMRVANAQEIPARKLSMEQTKQLIEDRGFTERLYNLYYKSPDELAK
jgi:Zn-dependent M28 family amino/carboxypeptidase